MALKVLVNGVEYASLEEAESALYGAKAGGGLMTVRELAGRLGCTTVYVRQHIRRLWPGLMRNGKVTSLTGDQAALLLEAMKMYRPRRRVWEKDDGGGPPEPETAEAGPPGAGTAMDRTGGVLLRYPPGERPLDRGLPERWK